MAIVLSALIGERPASGQIACSYDVVAVLQGPPGPLHESITFATAISPNGQHAVGWYRYDSVGPDRSWYWSQATGFITLPLPPGFSQATPSDINNSRVLCGTGWQNGLQRGFVYDMNTGQFTVIPPLGGFYSGAAAINEQGVICGTTTMSVKGNPIFSVAYTTLNSSVFTPIALLEGYAAVDIAEDGKVAVEPQGPTFEPFAFIWDGTSPQSIGPIPGGDSSHAGAIGVGAHIVGAGTLSGSNGLWAMPFHYRDGGIVMLPVLGGEYDMGNAHAVNSDGTIVGSCRRHVSPPIPQNPRACVWQEGQIRDLNTLTKYPEELLQRSANGVSDNGVIVVSGLSNDGNVAIVLAPQWAISGDTNCDGVVNVTDLLNVITTWGAADSTGDVNSDDEVNVSDLLLVITNWSA